MGLSSAVEKVRTLPVEDKVGEAIVKLRTPVWCLPKALRCLSLAVCELRQSGASVGVWHLRRMSFFSMGEGVSALVLVVLRLEMLG
ncbi:unnamed protein product [Prunus armeniaca]